MCVIFNNVSKLGHPNKKDHKYYNADDEEGTEIPQDASETEFKYTDFIKDYKNLLIESLKEQYCNKEDESFFSRRVEELFPEKNFYFY